MLIMTTVNESINHCVVAIRKQINCVITSCPHHLQQVASSKSDKSFIEILPGACVPLPRRGRACTYMEARFKSATTRSVKQARESSDGPAARAAVPVVTSKMSLALLA